MRELLLGEFDRDRNTVRCQNAMSVCQVQENTSQPSGGRAESGLRLLLSGISALGHNITERRGQAVVL